ncbi:MAG: hypothetical protein P8130_01915 [Deltaproteobacteria bacterium]
MPILPGKNEVAHVVVTDTISYIIGLNTVVNFPEMEMPILALDKGPLMGAPEREDRLHE